MPQKSKLFQPNNYKVIELNICLSKVLNNKNWEKLSRCYTTFFPDSLTTQFTFSMQKFKDNLSDYLEDAEFFNKMTEAFRLQDKAKLHERVSSIVDEQEKWNLENGEQLKHKKNKNNHSTNKNKNYWLLQQKLAEYLFYEEGKSLLQEYQRTTGAVLSFNDVSYKKLSFNHFLKKNLAKIQTEEELHSLQADYPQLYNSIKSAVRRQEEESPSTSYTDVDIKLTVASLHKVLSDNTLIAKIYHSPHFFEGKQLLHDNSLYPELNLNFITPDDKESSSFIVEENRKELFESGNFQGCIFQNLKINTLPLRNMNVRDCRFWNVTLGHAAIDGSDLRGVNVNQVTFYDNGKLTRPITLSMDPNIGANQTGWQKQKKYKRKEQCLQN